MKYGAVRKFSRKHSHKVFIIYSVRFSTLYNNCKTRNIFNCSNNSLLVCSLIEFNNNYLWEYNSQLLGFVFYLNRHIAASLRESFISCEIHGWSDERKMPNIHGWICAVVSRFRFHIRHQTKHVRQCLPKICHFYNGVSILNIGQSLGNDGLPVTNVKNWELIFITSVVEWNL